SKASSDHIVRSYHSSYGMNVVITHCSNNYGPMQHDEKFIPTVIRTALNEEPIPIYGNGQNIRDWIHVEDHCAGLDHAFHFGKKGETYNIGADCEERNIDICKLICSLLDQKCPRDSGKSYQDLISFVADRPGHDFRYAICSEKIYELSEWEPQISFEEGLDLTVEHYLGKYQRSPQLV
ncbi:MAG: dTDP-glucose 4,6-dehydratase, partial [Halioglobus sp.]